ncbi:MAG: Ig-like domain-containing protein [Saprospiraceae bacterium]|nr:Ig-like domain-containing protein [Saprospiraceae bacterium]
MFSFGWQCHSLNGLPASGTWTITRTPGGANLYRYGHNLYGFGLPANTNYTFTVTNQTGCTSGSGSIVTINAVPGAPVLSGPSSACVGLTANVSPASNGTWSSGNTSIATVNNAGVVNALSPGSVTLTYTRTSDGCSNTLPLQYTPTPLLL